MVNNYNTGTQETEIARMKQLMGYGLNESKSADSANVAFHQVGPDGNTYGIIKECNKFYIKVAPKKDGEVLTEDYDYIGGFMNKKQYEYPTYTIASKQFGLKMKSLNEAFATKENKKAVILDKPQEQAEWQVNETKEMRSEINRFNQLMNNVDYILSEGKENDGKALQLGSKEIDDEGGNAYQEKPVSEKKVNNMKEDENDPKKADDTYSEKPMSTDEVNKMKETSTNPKTADNTYSKKTPKTLKLTNEQMEKVLAWSSDKNYLDTTKGTEIGHDGDPYTEKTQPTNEAVYNSDDMNQHTGEAESKMKPFDDKVNEEVEIDSETGLPSEENAGQLIVDDSEVDDSEMDNIDTVEDFDAFDDSEADDFVPTEMEPEQVLDYETRDDMDTVLEAVVKKVIREQLNEDTDTEAECMSDALRMFKDANRSNYFDIEDEFMEKWATCPDCDAHRVLSYVRSKYNLDNIKHFGGYKGEPLRNDRVAARRHGEEMMNMPTVNEERLDVFGKHPAYQKVPMTTPPNTEPSKIGHEWDDDSVKGEQPFGTRIGHGGDPYTEKIIDMLTDSVVDKLMSNVHLKKKSLSERKVLNVPVQQPQTPPIDNTMPDDNGMEAPFGGVSDAQNFETDNMKPITSQNTQQEYGADFDAGVEANEDEDPKKFIQQLTGKLSQSLRKYNESLPKPDAELSKYVAGMILKQTTEGLSQEDVNDIVDKAKTDAKEDMGEIEAQETNDTAQNTTQDQDLPPMNETMGLTANVTAAEKAKAPAKIRKDGYCRKPFHVTIYH